MGFFRSVLLFISVLVFSIACAPIQKEASDSKDLPNIIFIVSEDNSPFLGCYGDTNAYTPNLDKLASEGTLYTHAFSAAPVCAPSRSSIITGMYANSLGSHHMRSQVTIPEEFHFFPYYLQKAGYYTVNRRKKDYNIVDQDSVWNESNWWDYTDMLKGRKDKQPFFAMFNTFMTHESKIHGEREDDMIPYYMDAAIKSMTGTTPSTARIDSFNGMHVAGVVPIPPYHPRTEEIEEDWARYYDCVSMMDDEVGELISNLERDSLLENTIIFYFSDHGGVIGRSKRFTFESGLHVPFIVRIPEKYKNMSNQSPGTESNRLISLIDLAPTVLNLAHVEIPDHFQGKPFLGENAKAENEYIFGFRGRMDERYDFCRTARNEKYRYIRNYMPHRPWGQHINYLWRARSIQSWEAEYLAGNTDSMQSRFWEPKPAEELYDTEADPHNVINLANNPDYREVLEKFRKATDDWMKQINDKNFIPEGEYLKMPEEKNGFTYYTGENYDFQKIKKSADIAITGNPDNLPELELALSDTNPVVRYWGAIGCCLLKQDASALKTALLGCLKDTSMDVRIASAEALYYMNEKQEAKNALKLILQQTEFTPYGSMEAIRTHALNVVDLMEIKDKAFFREEIESLAKREENGYDKRVAEYISTKNFN